jgi:adhesin transport system membrane fusion protein
MGWFSQARVFFAEVRESKKRENKEEKIDKDDLEYVSSASEAQLLNVSQGASFLIFLAVLCTAAIIGWSLVMQIDEVAKSQGKVIPSRQVQVIQTPEGGIVKEIKVIEGQAVKKNDILMIVDDVYAKSDMDANTKAYNQLLARYVALNALIKNKRVLNFPKELQPYLEIMQQERDRFNAENDRVITKIKEIEFQTEQKRKEYEDAISKRDYLKKDYVMAKQEVDLNKPLVRSGAVSKVAFLHLRQQSNSAEKEYKKAENNIFQAKSALNESNQKRESFLKEVKSGYEKDRNDVKAKLDSMNSKGVSLKEKLAHTIIKSPVHGIVKKIDINTIGGVLRPGEEIMQIVPSDDKLLIEVKIKPKDIGFISIGQKAKVKITAFDYSSYGGLEGEVMFLSADTITDKKGNSFYLARIKTKTNFITDKKGKKHTIIPGMKTEVDIILDQKSILTYILKPMLK